MNDKTNNNPIIYLDLNIISDLKNKTTKGNTLNIQLLGNLIYLQKKENILLPYSDTHLFEISLTGLKSKLSEEEREIRIQKDLLFIKALTSSKRLERDPASGNFYIHDRCPIEQYKTLTEDVPFFPKMFKNLIDFMPPKIINNTRNYFRFNKGRLNNLKSIEEVQKEIDKGIAELPGIMKRLTPIQKIANESLQEEIFKKSIFMINQVKDEFDKFASTQLENPEITEDEKILIQNLIDENRNKTNESIKIIKNLKPLNNIENLGIENIKNISLKEMIKNAEVEIPGNLDEKFLDRYMRNFWGYYSKNPKNGQTSDFFDIQHSTFMDVATVFITHEDENFRKRFGNSKCKIFNKSDFLEYLKKDCKFDIRVNIEEI